MKGDNNDDYKLHGYQDDLDTDVDDYDPLMQEARSGSADMLGVPTQELKEEMDKYDTGDDGEREFMERQDEGPVR